MRVSFFVEACDLTDNKEKQSTNAHNTQINLFNALFFIIFERC